MTIMVNGKEMELKAIGKNGIEWTNDLLGNYDALHYDEDQEQYTMSEDEFEWWEQVVEMLNEVSDLEEGMDEDTREEYEAEYWPSDLDEEARERLEWLQTHSWRSLSDIFSKQYVLVATDNSADSVDTRIDSDKYLIEKAGCTTLDQMRESAKFIVEEIVRNGAEDCGGEAIDIYSGLVRGAFGKEKCAIYVPSFWN